MAWLWFPNESTVTLPLPDEAQALACFWASVCSVVPDSTDTVCPHREVSPLKASGLPDFT